MLLAPSPKAPNELNLGPAPLIAGQMAKNVDRFFPDKEGTEQAKKPSHATVTLKIKCY